MDLTAVLLRATSAVVERSRGGPMACGLCDYSGPSRDNSKKPYDFGRLRS
jgi:hypothetical protein